VARALQFLTGFSLIVLNRKITRGRAEQLREAAKVESADMAGEGRLLWLTPLEWSMLLMSAALCGCLTLLIS
jgi:hypothetical protein